MPTMSPLHGRWLDRKSMALARYKSAAVINVDAGLENKALFLPAPSSNVTSSHNRNNCRGVIGAGAGSMIPLLNPTFLIRKRNKPAINKVVKMEISSGFKDTGLFFPLLVPLISSAKIFNNRKSSPPTPPNHINNGRKRSYSSQ